MASQDEENVRRRDQVDGFDLGAGGENDGLWDWNLATGRIHFSPRWLAMLGYGAHELGSTPEQWFRRIHPDDSKRVQLDVDALLAGNPLRFENEHRLLHKDGTYRWMSCRAMVDVDEKGRPTRMAGFHSDTTAGKVVDALTGLPNRVLFMDRLTRSIERARRHTEFLYAVLLLDFDRFKSHVEHLGSAAADQVLIAAARRLETSLRGGDTVARFGRDHVVARLGGDEFIILLDDLNEVRDAKFVAERLLKEISSAVVVGGQEVFLTASVGIAVSPTGYSRPEQALRDADTALHRAKSLGKARCEVFDTAILESAQSRLKLEADLREAVARQEFSVAYEPIVSLASGQIAGFEALMRWKHPTRGMVSPLEFIPVAERTGLIVPMGRWILSEACRQLKEWQDKLAVPKELFVSVNLASPQFKQTSLVEQIGQVLSDAGLEPRCLMLELTESAVMENPQVASSLLMRLRVNGVRIAIDDFGTGYSSLSYLRQFPVDVLKVDRSFVRRIEDTQELVEIVRTIGSLARQLGLRVIAEGIENAEQLNLIRALDCEYGQGYFFSRPLDSQNAGRLLKTGLPKTQETESATGNGGERIARADRSDGEPALSAVKDPSPGAPLSATREVKPARRTRSLLIASAALLLLVGGYAAILGRTTSQAAHQEASPPNAGPLKAVPAEPAAAVPVPSAATPTKSSARVTPLFPEAAARNSTPPPAKPRAYTFQVVHKHVLGSCKGLLTVSQEALSFAPEKGTDGFSLKYSEFSTEAPGDDLTIKSASRTYRFKSATARSEVENRTEVGKILQRISSARQNIPPKGR